MKLMHAMSGLAVAGLCLVALSYCWQPIAGGRRAWSDRRAKEHAQLSAEGHRMMHEQAEGPARGRKTHASKSVQEEETARKRAAREEIERRYAEVDAELRRAQNRGATAALVFRWLGTVCTIVGGAGYLVLRNKE